MAGKFCSKAQVFCLLNDENFISFSFLAGKHLWSKLSYFKERHLGPPTDTKVL